MCEFLGFKLTSSCWSIRHLANWAISLAQSLLYFLEIWHSLQPVRKQGIDSLHRTGPSKLRCSLCRIQQEKMAEKFTCIKCLLPLGAGSKYCTWVSQLLWFKILSMLRNNVIFPNPDGFYSWGECLFAFLQRPQGMKKIGRKQAISADIPTQVCPVP